MIEFEKSLKLTDLVDIHFLQEFQDMFARTMNVASMIVDDEGPITKPSNFTEFCIKYNRSTPEGYERCNQCNISWSKAAAVKGEAVIHKCHRGLTAFAVPIMVEGQHFGSILGGQVFTEPPNEEYFREIAKQIGVNEDDYIQSLKKIEIVPIEKLQESVKLLSVVANTISEIGHKHYELMKKNNRDNIYKNVVETIRSSLDIDKTRQKIVDIIGKTLKADRCFIVDYDKFNDKFLVVKYEYLSSDKILPFKGVNVNVETPNMSALVKQGKPLIINDKEIILQKDNNIYGLEKNIIEEYSIHSAFAFPLFYSGEFLASLVIHYVDVKHNITDEEVDLLTMVADQIALALHQSDLYRRTKTQAETERLYRNVTEAIRSSLDINETKKQICEIIGKTLETDRCFIADYDKNNDKFLIINDEYLSSDEIQAYKGADANIDVPKFAEALKKGNPLIINNKEIRINAEDKNFDNENAAIEKYKVNSALAFPLFYLDDLIGVLSVHYVKNESPITEDTVHLLSMIANQTAIAIHQAKLYKITQEQAEREVIVRKTIEIIRSSIELEFVKHEMVFQIGEFLKADRVAFADYDFTKGNYFIAEGNEYRSSIEVKTFVGYDFAATPGFIDSIREIHLTGKDIIFSDLDKYLEENNLKGSGVEKFYRDMGFMSSMAININHGNLFYGNLVVTFKEKRYISEEDIRIIKTLSDQAGIAIYQSTLFKKEKQTAEREASLRKIFEIIRSSLDIDETLTLICDEVAKLFNVQRATITEYQDIKNGESYSIRREYKLNADIKDLSDLKNINVDYMNEVSIFWNNNVAISGKLVAIDNISESDYSDIFKKAYETIGVKSIIGIPISKGDNKWGGLYLSEYNNYRHWTDNDITLLETISKQIYIAIQQAELYKTTQIKAKREKLIGTVISKVISTFDIRQIKQIINEIGLITKADRCYFVEVDLERMKGKPIDHDAEYLASPDVKSIIGYDFSVEDVKKYVELYLNAKDLIVFDYGSILQQKGEDYNGLKRYVNKFGLKSGIGIPFYYMDRLIAVLAIEYITIKPHPSDDELDFLRILGNQIGMAFSQIQLFQNTKKVAERETLLREVIETIRSSINLDKTLSVICDEVAKIFRVQRATIIEFYDKKDFSLWKTRREYRAREDIKGLDDVTYDVRAGAYNGRVLLEEGKNLVINNLEESDTPDYYKEAYQSLGVKSIISVPIQGGGDKFGIIFLSAVDEYRYWSKEEEQLLESIASQIHVAIRQAELFEKQKNTAAREILLRRLIETVRSSLDINEVKKNVIYEIGKEFKADRCYFRSYDKLKKEFLPVDVEYLSSSDIKSLLGIEPNQEELRFFSDEVRRRSKGFYPIVVDRNIEKSIPLENYMKSADIKSDYAIPIVDRQDDTVWLVLHYVKEDIQLSEDYKNLLETMAYQIEIAFNQIKLYDEVRKTAGRETLLRKLVETVRSSLDIKEVKKNIIYEIGKAFNADRCYFRSFNIEKGKFLPVDVEYLSSPDIKSLIDIEPDQQALDYFLDTIKKHDKGFYPIVVDEDFVKNTPLESYLKSSDIKADYGIPIIVGPEDSIWLVLHYSNEYVGLDEDSKKLLETIAYQIEMAFSQIRLYDTVKSTAERESLLREIFEKIRSSLDIDEAKKQIVDLIGKELNVDRCYITEYDKNSDKFLVVKDEYLSSTDVGQYAGIDVNISLPNFVADIKKGKSILVNNKEIFVDTENQDFSLERQVLEEYGITSLFAMPLIYLDEFLGAFSVQYVNKEHFITQDEIKLLKSIADQIATALHQSKLYKITQMQAEREKFSRNIIEILRSTTDKSSIKHLFVYNIGKYFKADRVFFSDYDPQNKMYLPVDADSEYLSSNEEISFVGYDWSNPAAREYIQPLLEKRELKIECWDEYIQRNVKGKDFISLFEDANVRSSYNIPVLYQQKIMGYFCIEFTQDSCHKLSNEDISSIRSISAQAGIALYHSELFVKAQESSRSKGEFIANISNELNAPLNNLIEFSEILSKSEFDCSKQIEYLNNINQSSKQLLDLKNDIFIINSIESDNFKLIYENISLEMVIMEVINSIKSVPINKEVIISTEIRDASVNVDKKMFAQILYNIVNNAIKLTSDKVHITVKSALDYDKVVTSIDVSGVGIMIDNQNNTFEKFKQIDSFYPRRQKGVGLELSIATKLVELHKGSIHVESTDDKGTIIWFSIPNVKR